MKFSGNIQAVCAFLIITFTIGYVVIQRTKSQNLPACTTKKYEAIIFDMDGTIIDTDYLWKAANAPILDSHAPHLSSSEKNALVEQFHALTIYEVWQLIEGHCSINISKNEIIEENIKHLHGVYRTQGISFIPQFHDFYEQVMLHDLKTAIATSSQEETVNTILEVVPLENYFAQHIYHADHVGKTYKPAPDVYLHAAKMIGVKPCNCIAIEDSATGIKAAKAAGMYCIGINTGNNRAALAQADEIVDSYSQINLNKLLYGSATKNRNFCAQ